MIVQYGPIQFQVEQVYLWQVRPVYDESGADFLYNHVRIGVQALMSPGTTGLPAITPTSGGPSDFGAVTFARIRQIVMQPRLQLTVTYGGQEILKAPQRRAAPFVPAGDVFAEDCKNGPQPLRLDPVLCWGAGRLMIVRFEVECYVNDKKGPPPFVSHRWEMTHDIDELNYTTRTISGTVAFRADYLLESAAGEMSADDWRARCFHPIPDNFKRESVRVRLAADGLSASYQTVDVEQPTNLGLGNTVLKIRGKWRAGCTNTSMVRMARRYVTCTVEVWGRRTTKRTWLVWSAFKAVAAFGFGGPATALEPPPLYHHANLEVDPVGRYCALSVGVTTDGAVDTIYTTFFSDVYDVSARLIEEFPEEIAGMTSAADGPNPRPPNGNGTRGTWMGRMLSQALSTPFAAPRLPPREQPAVDFLLAGEAFPIP